MHTNRVGECWLERLIQPTYWLDPLFYASAPGKRFADNLRLLHEFTRNVIRERKAAAARSSRERKAFLDLLIEHQEELSEEDIREEVDTFMFEGHDTTSMALSWILFLLGHEPDVQRKVWPEIDALFEDLDPGACVSLERLKDLKYASLFTLSH